MSIEEAIRAASIAEIHSEILQMPMGYETRVVIAHRLSTIENAGLIMVLENGSIVEQGSHQELLAMGGGYSDLVSSQFARDSGNAAVLGRARD
jgi:ABC-type multidrug transport system fused ATPase/permease subunit